MRTLLMIVITTFVSSAMWAILIRWVCDLLQWPWVVSLLAFVIIFVITLLLLIRKGASLGLSTMSKVPYCEVCNGKGKRKCPACGDYLYYHIGDCACCHGEREIRCLRCNKGKR